MDILITITTRIIKEQELIIGPLAWEEARKVEGLKLEDSDPNSIKFTADGQIIIDRLIRQYSRLFGRASVEACRDAVRDLLPEVPKQQIPELLK